MELFLENVRCFAGKHSIPIKPLTFLTGENSSGKTTFLAALAAVHDFGFYHFPLRPDFNLAPYSLGNFESIATDQGGASGHASTFSVGYKGLRSLSDMDEFTASYHNNHGLVEIYKIEAKRRSIEAEILLGEYRSRLSLGFKITRDGVTESFSKDLSKHELAQLADNRADSIGLEILFYEIFRDSLTNRQSNSSHDRALLVLTDLFLPSEAVGALSIAPIRTKPQRTYSYITKSFDPEGEHVPFVISNLLDNPSTRVAFERFGNASGLFKQIGIRKLGTLDSDPIQIMVTDAGGSVNLVDVGYGVSQALPIVVQSLLAVAENLLLLQQPEVHLHPRAQAALGSLFVDLCVNGKKRFVVETHSDYIIDRVIQEVAKGKISPDDVSILYFEKQDGETTVYPLALDNLGNILNAPQSYREFFLREELNYLNR